MTYGLNLKEKEELKIEAIDTGSFMHEVIDLFFKEIDESGKCVKEIQFHIKLLVQIKLWMLILCYITSSHPTILVVGAD